ncbi:MAG: hypothetical protein WCJ11_10485 [Methylococcaceae bacterium]
MYAECQTYRQPEKETIKVWRYMDFTKLVALLDSSQLYFARANTLEDKFEGSIPQRNFDSRAIDIATDNNNFLTESDLIETVESRRQEVAINCWHRSNCESVAMWKIYLKSNEGVAIQSTYEKLKKSFIGSDEVYLGEVEYINYRKESIDNAGMYDHFYRKRREFQYEKEVRAMVIVPSEFRENTEQGVGINIDIKTLIERIYIAPDSPLWFTDLVKSVIQKYDYDFKVIRSSLKDEPLF